MSLFGNVRELIGRFSRKQRLIVAIIMLSLPALLYYFGARYLNSRLAETAAQQSLDQRVEVTTRPATRLNIEGLRYSLEAAEARALTRYHDLLYVATAGGLLAFDNNGKLRSHYTLVDGLPSLDLNALAVFQNRLYIGSSDNGLAAFDGKEFIVYQFQKPAVRQIGALLADGNQLLIGSFDGGLFAFDGVAFSRRDASPIPKITNLLNHQGRLYVGSYDQGLFLQQEGRWRQFTKAAGLPSNHITALLAEPDGIIITTDFGIVLLTPNNEIQPFSQLANVTSLVRARDRLWGGLFTGGYLEIVNSKTIAGSLPANPAADNPAWRARGNTRLWLDNDETLFALTPKGIWRADAQRVQFQFEPFGELPVDAPLSAAHISTIALDEQQRLWVGYFDHGIDIFDVASMSLVSHLEDQSIREVNFIRADHSNNAPDRMLVATAAGLAIFDNQLHYRLIDERAGLSSNSVAHVSVVPDIQKGPQLAIATGRGLTMLQGAVARTPISLPNNYLYTSALINDRLFVGSLGGLIELSGLRAVRSLTISNSKLSHNWINALANVNGTLYIGTNGGGVDALLPSGELVNFAPQIGKFDVNPNAMYYDNQRLYVGTLSAGVYILDLATGSWHHLTTGLPSSNVSAITGDEDAIYIGTNNGLVRFARQQLKF